LYHYLSLHILSGDKLHGKITGCEKERQKTAYAYGKRTESVEKRKEKQQKQITVLL